MNSKNINNDPGMGTACALSMIEHVFYQIFNAGEILESDNRYCISDHIDLTEQAYKVAPDFMENQLPIFCDIYFHTKAKDNGERTDTLLDICTEADFVLEYTNAHPELPDAWDFMDVYFKHFKINEDVIILPHSKKIVLLKNLTIEDIIRNP